MLSNTIKRKDKGFTLIEVLIVLAIAGLILLVVFLAVPALQRNSRNTQRRTDISNLLAGVSEFSNNNNGRTPTGASYDNGEVTFSGGTGTTSINTSKIGFYKAAPTVVVTNVGGGSGAIPGAPSVDQVNIIVGARCDGNTPSTTGASARSVVAHYSVEQGGSGGPVVQCQESGS